MRRFAAATLLALSACSLFTDLGGFSDGSSGATDGGPTTEGGDARDGSADTGPGETSAPDASADVAESGAAMGCAAKPDASFCDDFDESDPLAVRADRWSGTNGSVSLTGTAFSAPSAAQFIVTPPGTCVFSILSKQFSGSFSRGRIELMLRSDGPTSYVTISMPVNSDTSYNIIASFASPTLINLYSQKYSQTTGSTDLANDQPALPASVFGTWVPVVVGWESTPKRRAYLRVGNVEASNDLPAEVPFANPDFVIGTWCESRATNEQIDDVAIYVTP